MTPEPHQPTNPPSPAQAILAYAAAAHQANADAEVSGAELRHELELDAATVRESVAQLARQGLVEWDPLLNNIWIRITDLGLMEAGRFSQAPLARPLPE